MFNYALLYNNNQRHILSFMLDACVTVNLFEYGITERSDDMAMDTFIT